MRVFHIADVHWRGLVRHDEYERVFRQFFDDARAAKPDCIVIAGDIWHTKTQGLTPEAVSAMSRWFSEMATICRVEVILGNHDGVIHNRSRMDAISPIVEALADGNIRLLKRSGTYPAVVPGFNVCVFSCFDEEGWPAVRPAQGEVNIAVFHGPVAGSVTDADWAIDGHVGLEFFDGFDFVMLGDIHKRQFLAHRPVRAVIAGSALTQYPSASVLEDMGSGLLRIADPRPWIAYPGSAVQQNFGESREKGYLDWDIRSADDFNVRFVPLTNEAAFVTAAWSDSVDATVTAAGVTLGSRVRVDMPDSSSPGDVQRLKDALSAAGATEVFVRTSFGKLADMTHDRRDISIDLRDDSVVTGLIRQHAGDAALGDSEWDSVRSHLKRHIAGIDDSASPARGTVWTVKRLHFDGTFSYGHGNSIDFDSMSGVVGIFGPNARGKSSIIGTLMYALFNTSDRGPFKNLHVINSRLGSCRAAVTIGVDGVPYTVERRTERRTYRGAEYGVTSLELFRQDTAVGADADVTGEQRTDTDRTIRKLIGSADDFMMTTLSAQGDIDRFVSQGSSQRKAVLSRMLGLDVIDAIHARVKEESADVRARLRTFPDCDWDAAVAAADVRVAAASGHVTQARLDLQAARDALERLRLSLGTSCHEIESRPTAQDIRQRLVMAQRRQASTARTLEAASTALATAASRLVKIANIKQAFTIESLRESKAQLDRLVSEASNVQHSLKAERQTLSVLESSVERLAGIPCGDSYPGCKFICNSHDDRSRIGPQRERVNELMTRAAAVKAAMSVLVEMRLEEKLGKYDEMLKEEIRLEASLGQLERSVSDSQEADDASQRDITSLQKELERALARDSETELDSAHLELKRASSTVETADAALLLAVREEARAHAEAERIASQHEEYAVALADWRVYEVMLAALSRKGIPSRVIDRFLPMINDEISKILADVVDFSVVLEVEPDGSSLDVFIDYGSGRRLIELASGMEKMMASVAIRVALTNVSTLPKTDMLIIDEGFGVLDGTNVAACCRLLESLKRWFRIILVVSHVDGIKDAADFVIEVGSQGPDSLVVYDPAM